MSLIRRMLIATIFLAVFSLLAVNNAYASNILVFAPGKYCTIPPPYNAMTSYGPPGFASSTQFTGDFSGTVTSTSGTVFVSWTAAFTYLNTVQQLGSVTSAAFMNYSIVNASVSFTAILIVQRINPAGLWINYYHPSIVWTDGGPGPFSPNPKVRAIDLEVTPTGNWISAGNQPFMWIPLAKYKATFLLWASPVGGTNPYAWFAGTFKDFTFVFMTSSPSEPIAPENTSISLSPPVGPVGTNVQVDGTGFAPASPITVTYDNSSIANTVSDNAGNFTASFMVPATSTKGVHEVVATDAAGNQAESFFDVFTPSVPLVGDVNNDGKIDIKDIAIIAKQFGKTDPNFMASTGSVGTTVSTQVITYSGISALATIGAVAPTAYVLQRKKNRNKITSEKSKSEA